MSPLRRNGSFGESHAWHCGLKALRVLVTCSTPHFDGPAAPAPVTSSCSVRRRCSAASSRTCRERSRGTADACHPVVDGAEELADGRALSIRLRRLLLIEAIKSRAWFKRRPHRAGEIQTRGDQSIFGIESAGLIQTLRWTQDKPEPERLQFFGGEDASRAQVTLETWLTRKRKRAYAPRSEPARPPCSPTSAPADKFIGLQSRFANAGQSE
jgi:hypothetical protein